MSVIREDLGRRRALYKLALATSDIESARAVARYAQAHVREFTDELWIPLQDALVVAYGRPFSANEPFGPIPSRWARFGNAAQQRVHNELVRMRNERVAHTDASTRSVVIFAPAARTPIPGLPPGTPVTMAVRQTRRGPEFYREAAEVCDDLLPRLHAAVQEELHVLFGHIPAVQPFDLLTGEPWAPPTENPVVLSHERLQPEDPETG